MAKKTARRAAKRRATPRAKKPAKAAKKPVARKTASAMEPTPVSTGRGATPAEIGRDVVALFNTGEWSRIEDKWWSPGIVSVEGDGVNSAWNGRAAVEAKNKWWTDAHEMFGAYAEGPYVGSSGFSIKFRMEYAERQSGKRWVMEEVGVYTVQHGKIVREEFMYGRKDEVRPRTREPGLAPVGG